MARTDRGGGKGVALTVESRSLWIGAAPAVNAPLTAEWAARVAGRSIWQLPDVTVNGQIWLTAAAMLWLAAISKSEVARAGAIRLRSENWRARFAGSNGEPGDGDQDSGGGGGGRIALYLTERMFSTARSFGRVSATASSFPGSAGTIYTKASSQSVGSVLVDNGGLAGPGTGLTTRKHSC